ncbi:MAG: hypothetical protein QXG67_02875, partial [Candidatus Nitrosotenuis sp.]
NLNVLPSKSQINSGETLDLLYDVYPPSSKVSLNTALRFDEIDNGFRVYGDEPGVYILSITAQSDGQGTISQELKIKINENDLQTEPWCCDQNLAGNYAQSSTNYLFIAVLIVASASGVFIFTKKKLKPKNYEEDLTF